MAYNQADMYAEMASASAKNAPVATIAMWMVDSDSGFNYMQIPYHKPVRDSIQFDQIVIKSFWSRNLTGTNFAGLLIISNDGLGSLSIQNIICPQSPSSVGLSAFDLRRSKVNYCAL